jgi:facilitated trehalose transporter
MLISIPYSVGFLLIGFASHVSMLYIGRILDGCMIGFTAPSAQIFVSINDLFQIGREIPFPFFL